MVLVDDGEIIVFGGLIFDDVQEIVCKVLLFGDIFLLGFLFCFIFESYVKCNLMVFIKFMVLVNNDWLVDMICEKYMGVMVMQFWVNDDGELVCEVQFLLFVKLENLFEGCLLVFDEYECVYKVQQ